MRLTSQRPQHQPLENTLPISAWGVYPAWTETSSHSRFPVAKRQALESFLLCSRSVSPMWHHIKLYRQPLVLSWCAELRVVLSSLAFSSGNGWKDRSKLICLTYYLFTCFLTSQYYLIQHNIVKFTLCSSNKINLKEFIL